MVKVILKNKKEESLLRFHPWVFSGAIDKIVGKPSEGDIVRVVDSKDNFLGVGHYQIGTITVRILSFIDINIDREFWVNRITTAYKHRKALGLITPDNNIYRLIHGEGDCLPGLIVDVYGDTAVLQAHSAGMHCDRKIIADVIVECVEEVDNVYYKSESTLPFKAVLDCKEDGYLIGSMSECVKQENGLQFNVDWIKGQKTGFFVDQRDNRTLIEKYSKDRDVLNMFCYSGGFSVYALRGGAKSVTSVDSSSKAIELTDNNVISNFGECENHISAAVDAFKYLDNIKDKYDLIILDPPAFAKHRDALKNGLLGYRKLNYKAFQQIKPGGIIFTFSCSQVVSKEQFRLAVFSAAAMAKREVQILHQLTQPVDHPINIYHPEGEYLKGLVLYVE